MFEQAPAWVSRSPRTRKKIIKVWRAFLRVQRATLAQAVVVVRRHDDRILVVATSSGAKLPNLELNGWVPVGTQVQEWLDHMMRQPSTLQLKAIDGTPGRKGVTFVYSVQVGGSPSKGDCIWLEPERALSALSTGDRCLLLKA